jgi:hypothetical protein
MPEEDTLGPLLENLLISQDRKSTETNELLEGQLQQGANMERLAEMSIEATGGILSELKKDKVHKVALEGVSVVTIKGDKGDTPEKGVDYMTPEELETIAQTMRAGLKEEVTPVKGEDYFTDQESAEFVERVLVKVPTPKDGKDGKDGAQGQKGDRGESVKGDKGDDGKDGRDGKNGKDGKDGSPDTPEQVAEKLNTLSDALDWNTLKNIPSFVGRQASKTVSLSELDDVDLTDVPVEDGKYVLGGGGGASAFINLTDVPADYAGDAGKFVKVKMTEDGLEFVAGAGVTAEWGDITGDISDQADLQAALDAKVDKNVAITGATKTKITYDADGLVTAGADATTADIADSSNKRYVTDAQLVVVGNTSGTNTGDVTISDTSEIDLALAGQALSASLVAASVDESKLDASVNASLDLADSSLQPGDAITSLDATAHRVFYSDGSGNVTELALGADGTFLKSNGAAVAPSFATPAGSGDVSKVGTPVNNQIGVWTGDGTIEGDADLTFDTATNTLATVNIAPSGTVDGRDVATDGTKLDGIESGAEVNNISDANATDLTDGGDSTLHFHSADRNRANHTGDQLASTISDFDTAVSANSDVAANTAARHDAVTVTDSSEINFSLTGQDITASLIASSIDESKLDASVNASLDLADTAVQNLSDLGITASAAELNTLDGITASVAELNFVDGVTSAVQTQIDGKQPLDSDLTAIAALAANGIVTRTGTGTMAARTIAGTTNQIGVTNGDGVAGDPVLALTSPLVAPGGIAAGTSGATTTTSGAQFEGSTTLGYTMRGSAITNTPSAGVSFVGIAAPTITITEAASGTHPLIAGAGVKAPVVTNGAGATAIAATYYIEGPPTGTASPTTVSSLYVGAGPIHALGTIELGNLSDTTLSRSAAGVMAVEGVVIPSISSTNTLTNKRVTKRTGTTTSSATPTINTDNVDFYSLTAQAADITSFTTNLSGTPTEGQTLWIAITGTAARAITWGASFEASTVALPTTTVTTNRLDVGFVWNTVTSKWRCVASA